MAKVKVFYVIYTTDDDQSGSIKAYCRTKEIAKRELKNYRDWYCDEPPKPDNYHIRKLVMIVN